MIRPAPRPACLDDAYEWLDQDRAIVAICPRDGDVIVVSTTPAPISRQDRFYLEHPEPLVRAAYQISALMTLRRMMGC